PERPAEWPRKDAQPDEVERAQSSQHVWDHRAANDPLLEGIAVDQKRCPEGSQAGNADRVPRATARGTEIGLARADVADQTVLIGQLTVSPLASNLDAQPGAREPAHLVCEAEELVGVSERVRERQHDGLVRRSAPGLVRAGRAAGDQADSRRCE